MSGADTPLIYELMLSVGLMPTDKKKKKRRDMSQVGGPVNTVPIESERTQKDEVVVGLDESAKIAHTTSQMDSPSKGTIIIESVSPIRSSPRKGSETDLLLRIVIYHTRV